MDSQQTSPRTPPRAQHARTPSLSSPMSLHHLGIISPLSPLRRQFSSPLARPSLSDRRDDADEDNDEEVDVDEHEEEGQDDLTQDSKDVLVERLNDLVLRLSRSENVHGAKDISALHAKVDEMEKVLAGSVRGTPKTKSTTSRPQSFVVESKRDDHDVFWGPPMSPSWLLKSHFPDMSESALVEMAAQAARGAVSYVVPAGKEKTAVLEPARAGDEMKPAASTVSSEVADKIVAEAETMCQELSAVVKSLQDRREESDHLHAMLIERAERAARRVVELQARIEDLEDVIQGNESELSFLRLQLRSIEVQCLEYIPEDADPELAQSIQNWKSDWADLRNKWAARRHDSHEQSSVGS